MTFRFATADVAFSPATPITATTNGPGMVAPGGSADVLVGVHVSAVSGTTPTLDVKVQESVDNVTYTDIVGAVVSQFANVTGSKVVAAHVSKTYLRVVATVGGTTPSWTTSVTVWSTAS